MYIMSNNVNLTNSHNLIKFKLPTREDFRLLHLNKYFY